MTIDDLPGSNHGLQSSSELDSNSKTPSLNRDRKAHSPPDQKLRQPFKKAPVAEGDCLRPPYNRKPSERIRLSSLSWLD